MEQFSLDQYLSINRDIYIDLLTKFPPKEMYIGVYTKTYHEPDNLNSDFDLVETYETVAINADIRSKLIIGIYNWTTKQGVSFIKIKNKGNEIPTFPYNYLYYNNTNKLLQVPCILRVPDKSVYSVRKLSISVIYEKFSEFNNRIAMLNEPLDIVQLIRERKMEWVSK